MEYVFAVDLTERVQDSLMRVTMSRYHAHVSAILGKETEWRRRLDAARRAAEHVSDIVYREGALAMVSYVEAEGYKRLAFDLQKELPRQLRIKYAQRALDSFARSHSQIMKNPESYNLLMQSPTEQ